MDGTRHNESLTDDAALERDLEALLAIEPSPGFAAQVRSRVAVGEISRGWPVHWRIAAVVASVAFVAGLTLWRSAPSAGGEPGHARTVQTVHDGATTRVGEAPPITETPTPRRQVSAHTGSLVAGAGRVAPDESPRRATEIALPAVVIAENEATAYARLRHDIRNARALPAAAPPEMADVDKALEIDPLVIAPIVEVASAE